MIFCFIYQLFFVIILSIDPLQNETADCTNEASECKFSGVATSRVLAGAAKQLLGTEVNFGTVGEAHGILLLRNGMVRGWGYNAYGQALGHVNNKTDIVDEPTQCDLGDTYNPSSGRHAMMCLYVIGRDGWVWDMSITQWLDPYSSHEVGECSVTAVCPLAG